MARVLIVDDEAAVCWALRTIVEGAGHEALIAPTAARALELFRTAAPATDAVFLDLKLPDGDGLAVLDTIKSERPGVPVVVITAHGGLETAVRAVQGGAADYLVKPLALGAVRSVLARVLAEGRAAATAEAPAAPAPTPDPGPLLVGRSGPMLEVFKRIGAVAGTDLPVLVTGESGTGKELVARALHAASGRRAGPFETIDCAAIPPELVESELYGHERGAFTGAVRERGGRVRRAHGGTVFLDEVGDLPLPAQAKLLRFLAERDLVPVGGDVRVNVDVRVIAATNRPLDAAVREGVFREDLYYRLNVFTIAVPPLRERKDDIPALVDRFLARLRFRAPVTKAALDVLARHEWPGNVRELRNAVEHAAALARSAPIAPPHLPAYLAGSGAGPGSPGGSTTDLTRLAERLLDEAKAAGVAPSRHAADRLDRALLEVALARTGGSISATARLLGLSRVTVRKRMRDVGLDAPPEADAPEGA